MRKLWLAVICCSLPALGQDAREIMRKSVELDQVNWLRMADYTWIARTRERNLDSRNRVTSEHEEGWETLILDGLPYRRLIERDAKPLSPEAQRKEQARFDKAVARLAKASPEEKQRQRADYDARRRRERRFLLEIPDAYDLRLEGEQQVDGRDVWVISGGPRPGYVPKSRDGKALLKVRGKMWIDKISYQWVRLEAQTTATISFGWFLARLNPGAKLVFEQERVNDEVWLPKYEFLSGSGRIGLLKRVAQEYEITWSDYRKFQVNSRVLP